MSHHRVAVLFRGDFSGDVLLWFTCKTTAKHLGDLLIVTSLILNLVFHFLVVSNNFSLVSRAEISARFLEQILMKSNWRLHGEGPSAGRNSVRAENPIPGKRAKKLEKSRVIAKEFQPGLKNRKKDGCRYDFSGIKAIKWRISLISKLRWNMRTSRQG